MADTSIGPAEDTPLDDGKRQVRATTEGVDAQNANEFDMEHGLAGAEAKPFSQPSKETAKHAFSSGPPDDPNQADPNERSDMLSERAHPGLHCGGGSPGR